MSREDREVVVITGASSGIGRATAIELASRGASVVVTSRDGEALAEVVRECEAAGGRALAVPADVTRDEEVQVVASRALAAFGRIDVWVNNAAVALFAKFEDAPPDVYQRVIETNLFGYVNGARAAMREFKKQHYGVLVNVDSVVAGAPQPYTSAYVASKYAIRGWSSCLRMELSLEGESNIHVCSVMPAAIDTPLFQHAANYTGRAVKALDPVYPVQKVARAIAKVIDHPRAEVVVGRAGNVMLSNYAMAPRTYERVMARQIDRNHLQDNPAPPSAGNLFESTGPKAVDGGWRRSGTITAEVRRSRWPVVFAGVTAIAAIALLSLRSSHGSGEVHEQE
ncbi:MAG: SDR family oxidoreductase [Acidobacteriota bacterium]|nr:SDR family oxidoreductase [Acidobacteriota bacterium]